MGSVLKSPHLYGVIYVALALVGDVLLKLWADRSIKERLILVAMSSHGIASAAWGYQMRLGAGFGRSAIILILANLIGAVAISRFFFGETITGQHIVGMCFASVAIILLV